MSLVIGTSATNRGEFEIFKDASRSEHLDANNNLTVHDGEPTDGPKAKPGLWRKHNVHNWASVFSGAFKGEMNTLTKIGEEMGKDGARLFTDAVDELLQSLGGTVILPVGDVFMFKGLNADESHNVFITITYDTPTGADLSKRENEPMSNSGQALSKPQWFFMSMIIPCPTQAV
ncbi:uncharacterized protein E0L32_006322 [Thyridium curvatum]|uniref:Uncharacterized protein n=1 Tax=Thyridium curvatum TaxID=1093900 RepID=A0A507B7G1_9PEZI|nr:uncharacterized protein E0L32_006322 [Thyridium curvatum]TPX13349.1 hypothetical protein E0L32_006322 [Thyridium curvatum]